MQSQVKYPPLPHSWATALSSMELLELVDFEKQQAGWFNWRFNWRFVAKPQMSQNLNMLDCLITTTNRSKSGEWRSSIVYFMEGLVHHTIHMYHLRNIFIGQWTSSEFQVYINFFSLVGCLFINTHTQSQLIASAYCTICTSLVNDVVGLN